MINSHKIVAVIPARGGSKTLPRKNIRMLDGKPLIHYVIESALSSIIDKVIVSTEDKEIANVCSKYEGVTVAKRPMKLARDSSKSIDVLLYTLHDYKDAFDTVVMLQPTTPFVQQYDINKAIEIFHTNLCDSVVAVRETREQPNEQFLVDDGLYMKSFVGLKNSKHQRQLLPDMVAVNGAVYVTSMKNLYANKTFFTEKVIPYVMPPDRSIDIDDEFDLLIADLLMKHKHACSIHLPKYL